ncbi:hypothetical protein LOD99_2417 [Oopsacas minuta]|uniref:Uncharacterized protein n=1 Tax=Oopsacas minuta TaxID=111878 RepID=A0AAV7K1Q2_9METZ|nr:hypothetical protein LOD99_2417 [Oopsacas minuta]
MGEGGVGKSSLTHRFMGYEFLETYDPTIEGTFRAESEVDGVTVEVEITDTAGQDSFRDIISTYYSRRGAGYMLVFSLTARDSFFALQNRIYEELMDTKRSLSGQQHERVPIVLIGNKSDLPSNREVQLTEGQAQGREWSCNYFETSAKFNENVRESFVTLIREMNIARQSEKKTLSKEKGCCTLFFYIPQDSIHNTIIHYSSIQSGLYSKTFTITTISTNNSWPQNLQELQNNSLQISVQAPSNSVPTEEVPLVPLSKSGAHASPLIGPSLLSQTFSDLTNNISSCEIIRFIPPDPKHACDPPVKPLLLDPSEIQHLSSSETPGTEGTVFLLTEKRAFLFFSCQKDLLSLRKENLVALCDFIEIRLEVTELFTLLPRCSISLPSPSGHEDLLQSMRTLRLLGFDLIAPNSKAWPSAYLSPETYSCLVYMLE